MFHLRDGLFFARSNATDVCIIKTSDGKMPWRQSGKAGEPFATNIVFEITVPENEWASVVCSVSVDGENHARWMRARRFHGTDLPFAVHELKDAIEAPLTPEQREWMDAPMGPSKAAGHTADQLVAAIDDMMSKLGYLIQPDRTVALAVVREEVLIQKARSNEQYSAWQRYKNELAEISQRHCARYEVEVKAHKERLAESEKRRLPFGAAPAAK